MNMQGGETSPIHAPKISCIVYIYPLKLEKDKLHIRSFSHGRIYIWQQEKEKETRQESLLRVQSFFR